MAEPMDTTPTEEEITKPDITSSGELDAANNVLVSHHYKLRKSLNFSKIHPLLNEHHLLPRDNPGDFVSLLPPVSNDDQIDKLVKCLTSSNNPQYLRRLIDCLRQTAHHVGAHDELADTLERALDEELANPSAKKGESICLTQVHPAKQIYSTWICLVQFEALSVAVTCCR